MDFSSQKTEAFYLAGGVVRYSSAYVLEDSAAGVLEGFFLMVVGSELERTLIFFCTEAFTYCMTSLAALSFQSSGGEGCTLKLAKEVARNVFA